MAKFIFFIGIIILWILCLNKGFPHDAERLVLYVFTTSGVLVFWIALGILCLLKKYNTSFIILSTLTLISCAVIYRVFPWYEGYTGIQLIEDYSNKKKNIKEVEVSWIYSLPPRIENFPLIDLAQRKFVEEIYPDKSYLFRCFYYDSSQVQKYVDQYIIYFKNNKPFTTKPSVVFTPKSEDSYELVETIDGKVSAIILGKNNFIRMVILGDNQSPDQSNENYYLSDGQYRFELKQIDPYNGFNIRKAYWIYRFL